MISSEAESFSILTSYWQNLILFNIGLRVTLSCWLSVGFSEFLETSKRVSTTWSFPHILWQVFPSRPGGGYFSLHFSLIF